jgi:hypothetical protein
MVAVMSAVAPFLILGAVPAVAAVTPARLLRFRSRDSGVATACN